jgi:excisionase family DNA binding protein
MSTASLQRLLTASDVAVWLSLTTRRVVRMARAGEIPSVELPGGERVFDPADLAEWLAARKANGTEQREDSLNGNA